MLANLIDPEPSDTRWLVLKRRGTKRLPSTSRDKNVAHFIAWRIENGEQMKNAKQDARAHFKIAEATVNRAWSKYGKDMTDEVRVTLADLKKGYIPRR
jgi:hypothetical protein